MSDPRLYRLSVQAVRPGAGADPRAQSDRGMFVAAPAKAARRTPELGVLGGMGPLASAAFLESIYTCADYCSDQTAPSVVVASDTLIPDRTEALERGERAALVAAVKSGLEAVDRLEPTRLVMCCFTAYTVAYELPHELQRRCISLPALALSLVARQRQKLALFCTNGTRRARLFENEACWGAARSWLVSPSAPQQQEVHDVLYALKVKGARHSALERLQAICQRMGVAGWMAGCTELHLLTALAREQGASVIDPLLEIASAMDRLATLPVVSDALETSSCAG